MNPFEKLRRAVDKYNINYEFQNNGEERLEQKACSPSPRQMQQTGKNYGNFRVTGNNEHESENLTMKAMIKQEQRRYIQQINQLSSKNERLAKSLKMLEVEKQQLIQQNCILEKNNQILQQKVKQIVNSYTSSEDRERRYKQEIHRINRTIEMLGSELNSERNAKKNALNDLQRLREDYKLQKGKYQEKISDYEITIKKLEQQIEQRSQMLQYNIKKSSEEKRQSRNVLEKVQAQYELKIQDLNLIINKTKDDLSSTKTNFEVLTHKYETLREKYEESSQKNQAFQVQVKQLEKHCRELQQNLRAQTQKLHELADFNEKIEAELEQEKNNIKLKVVEIKDQTLQLELQMYKRQCKDLLQEKVLAQRFNVERSIQPSYQIIQNK